MSVTLGEQCWSATTATAGANGKTTPYGDSAGTSEFAVESIRLLVTADGGGSNGYITSYTELDDASILVRVERQECSIGVGPEPTTAASGVSPTPNERGSTVEYRHGIGSRRGIQMCQSVFCRIIGRTRRDSQSAPSGRLLGG